MTDFWSDEYIVSSYGVYKAGDKGSRPGVPELYHIKNKFNQSALS